MVEVLHGAGPDEPLGDGGRRGGCPGFSDSRRLLRPGFVHPKPLIVMIAQAHNHAPADPEVLAPDEVDAVRRQIQAEVAMRLSGVDLKPVDELLLPTWVKSILGAVLLNFRMGYPDGLPPGPAGERLVRQEQRRALRWFEDELVARQQETD